MTSSHAFAAHATCVVEGGAPMLVLLGALFAGLQPLGHVGAQLRLDRRVGERGEREPREGDARRVLVGARLEHRREHARVPPPGHARAGSASAFTSTLATVIALPTTDTCFWPSGNVAVTRARTGLSAAVAVW